MAFSIHLKDGSTVRTCCPRCGLHYIESQRLQIASLSARDFETSAQLDAGTALYVEGSDVTPCASMHASSAPKDEHGCCLTAVYDRCLPSLLAFHSQSSADAFAREHGGGVKRFSEIRAGPRVPRAIRSR